MKKLFTLAFIGAFAFSFAAQAQEASTIQKDVQDVNSDASAVNKDQQAIDKNKKALKDDRGAKTVDKALGNNVSQAGDSAAIAGDQAAIKEKKAEKNVDTKILNHDENTFLKQDEKDTNIDNFRRKWPHMQRGVAFMTGVSMLAIGLSYLFRSSDWMIWLEYIRDKGRHASLPLGMITVFLGSFIVGFHWKWQGLPLVLSIIGVLAILKGFVYLLFPGWLPVKLRLLESNYRVLLPLSGIIVIAIALVILCEWQGLAYPS